MLNQRGRSTQPQRQGIKSTESLSVHHRTKLHQRCLQKVRDRRRQILAERREQQQTLSSCTMTDENALSITSLIREVMDDERENIEMSEDEYWALYHEIEQQLEREIREHNTYYLEDNERMLEIAYKRNFEHMQDEDIIAEDDLQFEDEAVEAMLRAHDMAPQTASSTGYGSKVAVVVCWAEGRYCVQMLSSTDLSLFVCGV